MSFLDNISGFQQDPFNITGTQNSIQRSLEQQIQNLKAGANASNSPSLRGQAAPGITDPLQLLQQQLFSQINSIPSYQTPLDQLKQQAQAQINSQYNPLIEALKNNMATSTAHSQRDQKSAHDMYNALATDIASQVPDITNQMHQAQNAASQRYDTAQQHSNQDYQAQSNQQQQILNQLGLQSAQQATGAQAAADQKNFNNQEQLQKQNALDALQQQGQSATTYQNNLSDTSRMAGDNQASQLQQQLSDYLNQANSQLGGLESQKSSGFQALLGQLQNADAKNAESMHQNQIDNLMKMFNFQLDTQKAMNSQQQNQQLFKNTNGPSGAANYLAQMMGPGSTQTEQQILQMINDTMADPNVVAGHHPQLDSNGKAIVDPVTRKPMNVNNTPQYMEDLLRSKMENVYGNPYSTGDINTALNALLAYLGQQR